MEAREGGEAGGERVAGSVGGRERRPCTKPGPHSCHPLHALHHLPCLLLLASLHLPLHPLFVQVAAPSLLLQRGGPGRLWVKAPLGHPRAWCKEGLGCLCCISCPALTFMEWGTLPPSLVTFLVSSSSSSCMSQLLVLYLDLSSSSCISQQPILHLDTWHLHLHHHHLAYHSCSFFS